jgi:hypothetical protein
MRGRRVSLRRSREREMRRIFGNGRRTGRDARSQAQDPLRSLELEGAALAPLLEGVAENVALHRFRPVPGYGACRFRRACALKRWPRSARAFSPREDKATAMRVLSLSGQPSASRSGSAVSTLIRKVPGLRCYRPGRFVLGEAAMTNAGSLAGMWRCISPHVFATVMARTGRLRSVLRPMAPSMRSTRITRKTLEPRLARGRGRAESRRRDGGMFVG